MANTIKIKRSATTATPSSLAQGELAYSELSDNLFIGKAGAVVEKIGGATDVAKLAGIEAGADVTDEANVTAAFPLVDSTSLVYDGVDNTKQMRIDVGAVGTGQVRVLTMANQDISLVPGVDFQTQDVDLDALAGLSGTGLISRTGAGTASVRTIAGTSNQLTVSNGDGVSGNPTIAIATNPTLPGTSHMVPPGGTTAQRPGSPVEGYFRYNSDTNKIEWWDGAAWAAPDTGGGEANQNAFSIITGDTGTANADATTDTLNIAGGSGITTVAADTPDSLTISLDTTGLTSDTAAAGTDELIIYDGANKRITKANFLSDYAPLASPALTGTPTAPTQSQGDNSTKIATTAYVDAAVVASGSGLDPKDSVVCNSTSTSTEGTGYSYNATGGTSGRGQITWTSGPTTIDGVTLTNNDRILNSEAGAASGIWVRTAQNTWDRAADFDEDSEVTASAFVFVEEGTTHADSGWVLTTNDPIIIGGASGTSLTWTQFSGAGQITAGAGLTKTGNTLNVGGTTNRIDVAADSIDISTSYVGQTSITTLGTIGTGTWQGTAVGPVYGGTGLSSYATGDLLYASAANTLAKLAAATDGQVLQLSGGVPVWGDIDGGTF